MTLEELDALGARLASLPTTGETDELTAICRRAHEAALATHRIALVALAINGLAVVAYVALLVHLAVQA